MYAALTKYLVGESVIKLYMFVLTVLMYVHVMYFQRKYIVAAKHVISFANLDHCLTLKRTNFSEKLPFMSSFVIRTATVMNFAIKSFYSITWVGKDKPVRVSYDVQPGVRPGVEVGAGFVHAEPASRCDYSATCPADHRGKQDLRQQKQTAFLNTAFKALKQKIVFYSIIVFKLAGCY